MANSARRLLTDVTRETRTSDPYPWLTVDEEGNEFRTHTAHADGYDSEGRLWQGWIYSPRTAAELAENE